MALPRRIGIKNGRRLGSRDGAVVLTNQEILPKARTAREAAHRLLVLMAVTSRAHEEVAEQTVHWVRENGIDAFFSPRERVFYYSREQPADQDVFDFSWRAEALVSIAWALGEFGEFPPLNEQTDIWEIPLVQRAVDSPKDFIARAALRPANEIERMESELYHQHWRVRDAQLFNKPMPPELDPGVVHERRYGLSWLVGWGDDWDDVPTDT